jgi:HK97 family phage prohead protease
MIYLGSRQFKALHGKRAEGGIIRRSAVLAGVRKGHVGTVEKLDDRTLRFTISTGGVDRDLDKIDVRGWQLDNYARNPVVLWAHRSDEPPIGKAVDFGKDDHRLFSAVQFVPGDGSYGKAGDFAEMIYRLASTGFLSATSVGFRPIKYDFTDDPTRGGDDWFPGIDFHEQELVELSIVPVPSNPDALIEPGASDNDTAPVIIPAPAQQLQFEHEIRERRRRRARAAVLSVW